MSDIYYYALEESNIIAKNCGETYNGFNGSPLSNGEFQFDMWGVEPVCEDLDWNKLRKSIVENGVRNSLMIALMPTASTSQIMGNYECFEPVMTNIYTRRVLSGEYLVLNEYLIFPK